VLRILNVNVTSTLENASSMLRRSFLLWTSSTKLNLIPSLSIPFSSFECPQIDSNITMTSPRPPYIFRAASDRSRGLNTRDVIDPLHGYGRQYHQNLDAMPVPILADMVYYHIRWKYKVPSEFSSCKQSYP
jgi:hypothetical protein